MEDSFNEKPFKDAVLDCFIRIRGAWSSGDMSGVRNLLTEDLFRTVQQDLGGMRAEMKINGQENLSVHSLEITNSWREGNQDFIAVRVDAELLDCKVDESTGGVAAGSRTNSVKISESWIFTSPVGNGSWRLAAINPRKDMMSDDAENSCLQYLR